MGLPLFIVDVRTIQIIVGISSKTLNKINPCRIRTLPTGFDTWNFWRIFGMQHTVCYIWHSTIKWYELIYRCWYTLLHHKLCGECLLVSRIFHWYSFMNVPAIRLISFKQRINFWSWLIAVEKSLEILNRSMIQNLSTSSFWTEAVWTLESTVQDTFWKLKFSFLKHCWINRKLKFIHNIRFLEVMPFKYRKDWTKQCAEMYLFRIHIFYQTHSLFYTTVVYIGTQDRSEEWRSKIKYVSYSR